MNVRILLSCIAGYLLGAVPFALVVGKVFFHTDIRKKGSGNLGGGNAGRVLGKKAGLAVMTLDILKVALAIFIAKILAGGETAMILAGLSAAVGHCYPVFAGFRGGKAVATMYGFLFGMMLMGGYSPWIFFLPLISFMVILYLGKIISLSSIGSALAVTVYLRLTKASGMMIAALCVFDVLMIWRHRDNLKRVAMGKENKITWM